MENVVYKDSSMDAVALASMLALRTDRGYKGNCKNYASQESVSDLRHEVSDVKSDIKTSIQLQDASNQGNFRHLDGQICETEKSAIIFAKDATIEALRVEARTADRITALERNVDMQFCDVKSDIKDVTIELGKVHTDLTHQLTLGFGDVKLENERSEHRISLQMERGFCKVAEDALKAELAELRRNCDQQSITGAFNTQLSLINSALTELNQNQRLTNSTINFGNGNLTGQSANANQVRGV